MRRCGVPTSGIRIVPLVTAIAMFAAILALRAYPLVDATPVVITLAILLLAPVLVMVFVSMGSDRSVRQVAIAKGFVISVVAVLIMTGVIFFNGALDSSMPADQQTRIVQKCVSHGKGGPGYSLMVASWRPGHDTEKLQVSWSVFSTMHDGEAVLVEVHPGLFGMQWLGQIRAA